MHIYRNAVVLIPTAAEHDKFAAFVEAYSDIRWCSGNSLSGLKHARINEAYGIEDGRVAHSSIDFYQGNSDEYQVAIENNLFLVTVDEYIARCLGWDDVESEINFDFGDVL